MATRAYGMETTLHDEFWSSMFGANVASHTNFRMEDHGLEVGAAEQTTGHARQLRGRNNEAVESAPVVCTFKLDLSSTNEYLDSLIANDAPPANDQERMAARAYGAQKIVEGILDASAHLGGYRAALENENDGIVLGNMALTYTGRSDICQQNNDFSGCGGADSRTVTYSE